MGAPGAHRPLSRPGLGVHRSRYVRVAADVLGVRWALRPYRHMRSAGRWGASRRCPAMTRAKAVFRGAWPATRRCPSDQGDTTGASAGRSGRRGLPGRHCLASGPRPGRRLRMCRSYTWPGSHTHEKPPTGRGLRVCRTHTLLSCRLPFHRLRRHNSEPDRTVAADDPETRVPDIPLTLGDMALASCNVTG